MPVRNTPGADRRTRKLIKLRQSGVGGTAERPVLVLHVPRDRVGRSVRQREALTRISDAVGRLLGGGVLSFAEVADVFEAAAAAATRSAAAASPADQPAGGPATGVLGTDAPP